MATRGIKTAWAGTRRDKTLTTVFSFTIHWLRVVKKNRTKTAWMDPTIEQKQRLGKLSLYFLERRFWLGLSIKGSVSHRCDDKGVIRPKAGLLKAGYTGSSLLEMRMITA